MDPGRNSQLTELELNTHVSKSGIDSPNRDSTYSIDTNTEHAARQYDL
jgi:argininosuccinate synthase